MAISKVFALDTREELNISLYGKNMKQVGDFVCLIYHEHEHGYTHIEV